MHKIIIKQINKTTTIYAEHGKILMDVLNTNGIFIDAPCGGRCICGKCKVKIDGEYAKDSERKFLTDEEYNNGFCLACTKKVTSDMEVFIPNTLEYNALHSDIVEFITQTNGDYGIAVDVGTTTIAVCLINMSTGEIIDSYSGVNFQRQYGADVISRITYTIDNIDGTKILQKCIINQLENMITDILDKNGVMLEKLKEVVVAGNTIMQHFIMGKKTEGLALSPFKPEFLDGIILKSQEIGFETSFILKIMPSISAYIGGDISAAMISCNMHMSNKSNLLIDIGTNGEMVIGNADLGYFSASVAAGPAFEGNHIKCGVGSVSGAIDHVFLNSGMVEITTINKKPSIGICGSGIVDLVAELLHNNVINKDGTFNNKLDIPSVWRKYIVLDGNEVGFRLTDKVIITQQDIREIQLAKAAFSAGVKVLIDESIFNINEIDTVFVAGGMGYYIDKLNASDIGILPKELIDKVSVCGNASLNGAIKVLKCNELFNISNEFKNKVKNVELSNNELFGQLYIENINF